jgi:hypothetical protein
MVAKRSKEWTAGYEKGFVAACRLIVGDGPKSRRYWTHRDRNLFRRSMRKPRT